MKFTLLIATAVIAFCNVNAAPVRPTSFGLGDLAKLLDNIKNTDVVDYLDQLEKIAESLPVSIPSGIHPRADPPVNDDGDDPELTERVHLDEKINEIYRLARVEEIKEANPEMILRQEELDMIVSELQSFGLSVDQQEFCDKIKHHVDEFELKVSDQDLADMCKQKYDELHKIFEDEERAFAEAEKDAEKLNAEGIKSVLHWLQQDKAHNDFHKSFADMERERWIDKQLQRGKHNAAVKAGLKQGEITKRA